MRDRTRLDALVLRLPGLRRYGLALVRLERANARMLALEGKLADQAQRLRDQKREVGAMRAQLDDQRQLLVGTRVSTLARLTRLRNSLQAAKRVRASLDRARRDQPTADVLAHLLPLRHAALIQSGAAAVAATEHASRLQTSAAYRAAFEVSEDAHLPADRLEINGVTIWVPQDARGAGSLSDRLHRGQLPLREIVKTREVSIGRVMIDIGANIGTTSIPRVVLGDVGQVFAAEPEPRNFACLVRSIRDNRLEGLVVPSAVALSDREGEMPFKLGTQIGTHRLAKSAAAGGPKVRMTTLDIWARELGVDLHALTFVKCDTQGHEPSVLRGAAGVLARRQAAWQIEFSPGHLRRAGVTELYTLLERHFDWFIDIGERAEGDRVRPATALAEGTAYVVERRGVSFTNLLLFNGPGGGQAV